MLGVMNDAPRLTRDDFRRLAPVAMAQAIPTPDRVWSDEDWRVIERGHKSADMDDKWNALVVGHKLYLHRSWTGRGIYEAEFAHGPGGWQIVSAVVEGDRTSYRRHRDDYETALLEALIDGKLLGVFDGPGHQRLDRIRAELGMT
jgi:hypothetical protein